MNHSQNNSMPGASDVEAELKKLSNCVRFSFEMDPSEMYEFEQNNLCKGLAFDKFSYCKFLKDQASFYLGAPYYSYHIARLFVVEDVEKVEKFIRYTRTSQPDQPT